jgi:hypothetical protein
MVLDGSDFLVLHLMFSLALTSLMLSVLPKWPANYTLWILRLLMRSIAADIARQVDNFRSKISRPDRPIIAAAMVRDEADIIERFARHAICWADSAVNREQLSI